MSLSSAQDQSQRVDTGMAWSVKESFVSYIESSRDGRIVVENGAGVTDTGEFFFPLSEVGKNSTEHQLAFRGTVRFEAHYGLLSVVLQAPRLLLRETSAELAIDDHRGGWQHLAHLSISERILDGHTVMWENVPTQLVTSGVELFGNTYSAGEALAPITLRIPSLVLESHFS